jgi:HAMP domain-containing protein
LRASSDEVVTGILPFFAAVSADAALVLFASVWQLQRTRAMTNSAGKTDR